MISIICVYNNEKILNNYLLASLKKQNNEHELILIDNTSKKFKSAAEALNYGGKRANGNYLMFIHQDFELEPNSFKDLEEMLSNLENLGIAGVAGKIPGDINENLISKMKTGVPPKIAGNVIPNEPQKVQTLDECLIVIPHNIFQKIKFNEDICDNWHLYAVDYCLTAKVAGYDAYVIPISGYHVSPGYSFSEDEYYPTLRKLVKRHKKNYKYIYTTTGHWNTRIPLFLQIYYKKLYFFMIQYKWLVKVKRMFFS